LLLPGFSCVFAVEGSLGCVWAAVVGCALGVVVCVGAASARGAEVGVVEGELEVCVAGFAPPAELVDE